MDRREIFTVVILIFIGLILLLILSPFVNSNESVSKAKLSSEKAVIEDSKAIVIQENKASVDRRYVLDEEGCYESLYQRKKCPETEVVKQERYNCERTIEGRCNPYIETDRLCYESLEQVKTCPDKEPLVQKRYNCERTVEGRCNPQVVADRACYTPIKQTETCPDPQPVKQVRKICEKANPDVCKYEVVNVIKKSSCY